MDPRILDDPLAKRDLLYSAKVGDPERNAAADLFLQAERYGEALEFLEITRDTERLQRIEEAGMARGDTFLLQRVEKIRGVEIPPGQWRKVAETAVSLGRFHDAYRALLRAGDEEEAEAFRAERLPDYEPFRPEGK